MNDFDLGNIRKLAESVFTLGVDSCHGVSHWKRVENNFLLLAKDVQADVTVGRLFAVLHDCCRRSDGRDREHGLRAAMLIRQWYGNQIMLEQEQVDKLVYAVENHTFGDVSDDPTVAACWDADRLDLGRVGIVPNPSRMCTVAGKELAGRIHCG
jgi:uncharacterized protein